MSQKHTAISLFSGAFGLDLGLEKAGFQVLWANELEKLFCNTIEANRPEIPVVPGDIRKINPKQVLSALGLSPGEVTLVSGGPPCQSFSTAGRRQSIQDPRGDLVFEYVKWIDAIRPRYFIMENVRGLLSAALQHVPLSERINGREYAPEEIQGSTLRLLIEEMERLGYAINYKLLNAADFGVPQTRQRVIFIGSRDGDLVDFPDPTHSKDADPSKLPYRTLRDALTGLDDKDPRFTAYSEDRLRWLRMVPPGSNWRSIPAELQEEAMGGAYKSGGGKVGFYRRLGWDKPSPTITTSPAQKATDMCHPDFDRPLSVREAARLQQFPDDWVFSGSVAQQYKQIGNAVPVGLAEAIGDSLMTHIDRARLRAISNGDASPETQEVIEGLRVTTV